MNNKIIIIFIVMIGVLTFNILSIFDIIPNKIANIIYIIFSIIGLITIFKMGVFNGINKDLKDNFKKRNDKFNNKK